MAIAEGREIGDAPKRSATDGSEYCWGPELTPPGLEDADPRDGGRYHGTRGRNAIELRDAFPEPPDARVLPVEFEVTHPPRRNDQRWTVPTHLVREATDAQRKEANLGLVEHRPEPTTA